MDPSEGEIIKGMRQLDNKNIVVDLQSKNQTWADIGVPKALEERLLDLKMNKPSFVQAFAIPKIIGDEKTNFMFQAMNGSGKTLSFGIPALMKVDPTVNAVQAIIIANTRELVRQIQQVLETIARNTEPKINIHIGDTTTPKEGVHVIVTTVQWISNRTGGRAPLDLSKVKLIAYDEADEVFKQETNQPFISKLAKHFERKSLQVQACLFSATFEQGVKDHISSFFTQIETYPMKVDALRLKGVKQFRMGISDEEKQLFIQDVYNELPVYQTMIFMTRKKDAIELQKNLIDQGIKAEKLIGADTNNSARPGGNEDQGDGRQVRDQVIDDFRKQCFTTLISTNVLARGIDIPEVDLVINFDVPHTKNAGWMNADTANFLHRSGRTGRFGTDGCVVTLVGSDTESQLLDEIEAYYGISSKSLNTIQELGDILAEMRNF